MSIKNPTTPAKTLLPIWWILWVAILGGLIVLYVFLGRGPVKPSGHQNVLFDLVGLVPLFLSIIIRWLVLPRFDSLVRAFPLYIAGMALAESCGILGIFLGGAYRDDLFVLGVLGVAQFVPVFARRLDQPKGHGFFPNN